MGSNIISLKTTLCKVSRFLALLAFWIMHRAYDRNSQRSDQNALLYGEDSV